jgi:hypothetical protein
MEPKTRTVLTVMTITLAVLVAAANIYLVVANRTMGERVANELTSQIASSVNSIAAQNNGYISMTFNQQSYECFQVGSPSHAGLQSRLATPQ